MEFSKSLLAAKLQELVSVRREDSGLYHEVADTLPLPDTGRLLDIGTGTGLQLSVIRQLKPDLDLFGLDVSEKTIRIAGRYLATHNVNLSAGSIEKTDFKNDYFNLVTCANSMSYWKNLTACFDEIHRILLPGGSAHLIEPRANIDIDHALETIRTNLEGESVIRKFLAVNLNKFALRRGRSIGLHLYAMDEIINITQGSKFDSQVSAVPITLQNLPIFMHITLTKPIEDPPSLSLSEVEGSGAK